MRIVAVGNHKGGVAKTTTVFTLASLSARDGARVLMVDLDPQGSLTAMASGTLGHERTLGNVLCGVVPSLSLSRVVIDVAERLEIAPGGPALKDAETALAIKVGRESYLKRALAQCKDRWDVVVIDTPPMRSVMTDNALAAADSVLIPTQAHALDLAGLQEFRRTVAEVQEMINPRLKIAGVLATFYDGRLTEHRHSLDQIKSANLPLCKTTIGRTVRFAESSRHCRSIIDFASDNPQAAAYEQLARELGLIAGEQNAQRIA